MCRRTLQTPPPPNKQLPQWQTGLLRGAVALRTRLLHKPYGDQGVFVRRTALERVGGLREWPLMEDVALVDDLKAARAGAPAVVRSALETSGRRWQRLGFWTNTLLNQSVMLMYALGVDAETLAEVYGAAGSGGGEESGIGGG